MNYLKACEILGVNFNSTDNEIKTQYKALILQHHPDKGGTHERFVEIQEAFEFLKRKRSINIDLDLDHIFSDFLKIFKLYTSQTKTKTKTETESNEEEIPSPIELTLKCSIKELRNQAVKKVKYSWINYDTGEKNSEIIVIPTLNYAESLIIESMGDICNGIRGDIVVSFIVKSHKLFQIQHEHANSKKNFYDIWIIQKYPFNKFLLGNTIDLSEIDIDIGEIIHKPLEESIMHLYGKGLPYTDEKNSIVYGDIYICAELDKDSICKESLMENEVIEVVNRITCT